MDVATAGARRRISLVLIAAAALLLAPSAGAQSPEPSQGIGIRPLPGTKYVSATGSFFEVGVLAAGQSVSLLVEARNVDPVPRTVRLYGADATPSRGGGFAFAERTAPRRDVGAWLRVTPDTLRLGGGQRSTVRAVITMPANATPGEHVGGIVAEPVEPPRPGIRVATRVAVAIYLRTPGASKPAVEIERVRAPKRGGTTCAEVTYRNTGNTVVDPEVTAEYDPWIGGTRSVVLRRGGGVRPGDSLTVPLPCFRNPPLGPGKVTVTVRYPGGQRDADIGTSRFPWWLWLLLILPLLLLFLWWLWRRRRRERDELAELLALVDEQQVRALAAAEQRRPSDLEAPEVRLREIAALPESSRLRSSLAQQFREAVTAFADALAVARSGDAASATTQAAASEALISALRRRARLPQRARDWQPLADLAPRRSTRTPRRPRKD